MYNTFLYNLLKNPLINDKVSTRKGRLNANEFNKLRSILLKSLIMALSFALLSLIIFYILKEIHFTQRNIIIFTASSTAVCIILTALYMKTSGRYLYLGYIYILSSACLFSGLVFINIYTDIITVKFITDTYIVLITIIYLTGTNIISFNNKYNQLFTASIVTFLSSLCVYAVVLIIMYKTGIFYKIYSGSAAAYILSDIIIIFLASAGYTINMELIVKSISVNISRNKQIYFAFSIVFYILWFIIIFLKYIKILGRK